MNIKSILAGSFLIAALSANAQFISLEEITEGNLIPTSIKHEQRIQNRRSAASKNTENALEKTWQEVKHLTNTIGLDVGVDISYLAQRATPNGKQTAILGV